MKEAKKAEHSKKEKELLEWEQAQQHKKELKSAFDEWRFEKVKKLLEKMEQSKVEQYKTEFVASILEDQNSFFAKMYQTKGFEFPVIQNHRHKFLAAHLLAENDNDFENYKSKQLTEQSSLI